LLLSLLSVKLLTAVLAAASELRAEKFNGTLTCQANSSTAIAKSGNRKMVDCPSYY